MPRASPRRLVGWSVPDGLRAVEHELGTGRARRDAACAAQRPLHDGRAGAPVRGCVRGALRHEARGDGQFGLVGESRRHCRALLPLEPSAAARRRSHRACHLVGDDLPPAAAVRVEAAVRRRRARHAQHGCVEARSRTDAAHAHGRRGQHSRQSRAARSDTGVLRRARSDPVRGQLRVDGRQPQRPAVRHVRRHQHLQHLLFPSHLDDGRGVAGDERHGDRSSRARDSQSWVGARCAGRLDRQSRAAA